jgi:C-terminal processing protease CtpA/Prc
MAAALAPTALDTATQRHELQSGDFAQQQPGDDDLEQRRQQIMEALRMAAQIEEQRARLQQAAQRVASAQPSPRVTPRNETSAEQQPQQQQQQPQQQPQQQQQQRQQEAGIGIVLAIDHDSDTIVVESLAPWQPAALSGKIARGDVLVKGPPAPPAPPAPPPPSPSPY